jgi:hypothetical protein
VHDHIAHPDDLLSEMTPVLVWEDLRTVTVEEMEVRKKSAFLLRGGNVGLGLD